jgi:hypothetical protein
MRGWLAVGLAVALGCSTTQAQDKAKQFQAAYAQLQAYAASACDSINGLDDYDKAAKLEQTLLDAADSELVDALNRNAASPQPASVARAELDALQHEAESTGSKWAKDVRFRFTVKSLPPVVAVTMAVRNHEVFAAYALAQVDYPRKGLAWKTAASSLYDTNFSWSQVELRNLQRGPAGHARLLAKTEWGGCAGSYGVKYEGLEWDPQNNIGEMDSLFETEGAWGLETEPGPVTAKNPFPMVGAFTTIGSRITLPYCMFTGIDWWDNPSLCAVETWDLSGDQVRFVSRRWNRPELLPIARAMEFAGNHEFVELRAWCASDELARRLMAIAKFGMGGDNPAVKTQGPARERVTLDEVGTFIVEKRGDQWVVAGYTPAE